MALIAIIIKEFLLLIKDKVGLVILFILPVILLILVSLTQQKTNDSASSLNVLLINKDKGKTGKDLVTKIIEKSSFKVKQYKLAEGRSEKSAKTEIAKGKYNALIIIDKNLTKDITTNMRYLAEDPKKTKISRDSVIVYFDPVLPESAVKSFKSGLEYLLQSMQLSATQKVLLQVHHDQSDTKVKEWFPLKQKFTGKNGEKGMMKQPSSVQQNVPAWTLFGMFFIVIPLAGQMVRERSMGVIQRIRIAPIPQVMHLIGRVICYVILNLIQMSFMLLVAVYVLPLFDLPALNLAGNLPLVYLLGFCASLASIGFGLVIGMYATSYQQATIFAPFVVVIAASVSGIFVPLYLMPGFLTYISNLSPMYWAQTGFLNIFVRGDGFVDLLPNMLKLVGFFVLTLIIALLPFTKLLAQRKVK